MTRISIRSNASAMTRFRTLKPATSASPFSRGTTWPISPFSGQGKIDGNGTRLEAPKPIALKRCRNVRIHDLTIANAPNYNISLLGCDGVNILGVTIRNGYSDGIDPDCCQNVRISNCLIESQDDAIVLK